jgi:hypothetical protein
LFTCVARMMAGRFRERFRIRGANGYLLTLPRARGEKGKLASVVVESAGIVALNHFD